jgi:magnesium-transporting ATPase (P-type)
MKQFRLVQPEDAEVLRNSKWIRYDAASLVLGDIIRLVEGDVVPADCVVISLGMEHADETIESMENGRSRIDDSFDMTVDSQFITGETRPRRITSDTIENGNSDPKTLYYGSRVLEGACIALVIQTGKQVLLANLIREGRWPPKEDMSEEAADIIRNEEEGISLMTLS